MLPLHGHTADTLLTAYLAARLHADSLDRDGVAAQSTFCFGLAMDFSLFCRQFRWPPCRAFSDVVAVRTSTGDSPAGDGDYYFGVGCELYQLAD